MKSLILSTLTFLSASLAVFAESTPTFNDKESSKLLYRDITEVKKFFNVYAILQGSAEKIGLDQKELNDYVSLRFKNLFTGFPLENLPKNAQGTPDYQNLNPREWAILSVVIWTVGDDYPVAYHIKLEINKFAGGTAGYQDATLGYASASALKNQRILKDTISELMERAAAKLFEIQDKL